MSVYDRHSEIYKYGKVKYIQFSIIVITKTPNANIENINTFKKQQLHKTLLFKVWEVQELGKPW